MGGREPLVRAEEASRLVNAVPATAEGVARGRDVYGRTCAMCHGADGRGTGPVGRKFVPPAADLTTGKVQGRPPLRHHHERPGQHAAPQGTLTPEERWAAVHYVRTLGPR